MEGRSSTSGPTGVAIQAGLLEDLGAEDARRYFQRKPGIPSCNLNFERLTSRSLLGKST
jgi:hypothetical protein